MRKTFVTITALALVPLGAIGCVSKSEYTKTPPLHSSKRVRGLPALPFATVEDDSYVGPVLKVAAQLFVPVQAGARHDKDEHVSDSSLARPVTVAAVAPVVSVAAGAAGVWASDAAALGPFSGVTSLRDFGVSRDSSLEDLVRPHENRLRDRQPEGLSRTSPQIAETRSIGHEAASISKLTQVAHRG